jgi:hypothetical protein
MSRLAHSMRVIVAVIVGSLLWSGVPISNVRAAADPSDVVLVLDFSASILKDKANRERFAAALEKIAARVDETSADLVQGDATVSIIQFATRAADYPGCTDLHLLGDAKAVAKFADCLRAVAAAYRKGLDPALTAKIGIDTNYVAAMEAAAKHLPADAVRPGMILFTDGKHDVAGVPVSQVQVTQDRLFGTRTPFALLPVGMGLQASERATLEAGLTRMRIVRDMPPCVSGAAFDWPQVVFTTPDEAGNAVAVALQDATCTFTVEATPIPSKPPAPAIPAVPSIRLTALDASIQLTWGPSAANASAAPIIDYKARCRPADGGDYIESSEGVSLERKAVVTGLTNGITYRCEVAAVGPSSQGPWTPASGAATPTGLPPAPDKPTVDALDRALRVSVKPFDPAVASGYHYECSRDNGTTWPGKVDVLTADKPAALIPGLTNGVAYVCRAFAVNTIGMSAASPLSKAVQPCGSPLDCNPTLIPILGVIGVLLLGGLLVLLVLIARSGSRGYVLAVVDVVHAVNLGHGSKLGIAFVHAPDTHRVTGVVADPTETADIRVRYLGRGRFVVRDRVGRRIVTDGEPIIAADSVGGKHEVVLRAFDTNAASPVSSRR